MAKSKQKKPQMFSLRIALELANRVAAQANNNKRSLPKEVEVRLEQSLKAEGK